MDRHRNKNLVSLVTSVISGVTRVGVTLLFFLEKKLTIFLVITLWKVMTFLAAPTRHLSSVLSNSGTKNNFIRVSPPGWCHPGVRPTPVVTPLSVVVVTGEAHANLLRQLYMAVNRFLFQIVPMFWPTQQTTTSQIEAVAIATQKR